jgi:hypothetical protein
MNKVELLNDLVSEVGYAIETILDEVNDFKNLNENTKLTFYSIVMDAIEDGLKVAKSPLTDRVEDLESVIKDKENQYELYNR